MKLESGQLAWLATELSRRVELEMKRDVQFAAQAFGRQTRASWLPEPTSIDNGDDAAAIRAPHGGYVLLAAEGLQNELVANDPWFAGFCAVMVNVADVAAMGGRPWAVVDVLFLGSGQNERILEGMQAASAAFGVPNVGGHTARVRGTSSVAAAIVGHARALIESRAARPGQALLAAIDLRGSFRGRSAFNAATSAPAARLREQLSILPELAESGAVLAGKDVSNAGLCGTLLMLLESSGRGARLDLARVPAPARVDPLRWLTAFPSFGFLLTSDPRSASGVCERFREVGVACEVVGEITRDAGLELQYEGELVSLCELTRRPLTGFGACA